MSKKITAAEIDKLYLFTKQHYVYYYDLQTELVDHLANGIEKQWVETPNVTFYDALQIEFKKFGVFGFTDLVTERQRKLSKHYSKLILSILKSYFTIPKIFLTTLLVLLTIIMLSVVPYKKYVVIALFLVSILMLLVKSIRYRVKFNKSKKAGEKLWMYEEIINTYGHSFAGFQLISWFPQIASSNFFNYTLNTHTGLVIIAITVVVFNLGAYIAVFIIPPNAKEHISKVHPEYKLT